MIVGASGDRVRGEHEVQADVQVDESPVARTDGFTGALGSTLFVYGQGKSYDEVELFAYPTPCRYDTVIQVLENDHHEDYCSSMRHTRPRQQHAVLYRLSVVALCTTYGLFFFLSSLCFATGLLHPHGASGIHHHRHETDHRVTLLDICDLTLLMLTTTDLEIAQLPAFELSRYNADFELRSMPLSIPLLSQPAIRAPPYAFS